MYFRRLLNIYRLSNFFKNFFKKKTYNKNKKVLVEFYEFAPTIIPFAYFANALATKYNADINCYRININNFYQEIKFFFKKFFLSYSYLYKSFGSKKIISPNIKKIKRKDEKYIFKLSNKINNKNDLIKLKFKNIPIGDYIYDDYLRRFDKITVDINSDHFKKYFQKSLKIVSFWFYELNPKHVKAVIISHTTYLIGLIGIIATYKNIPTYRVSLSSNFRLSKKKPKSFDDFNEYPKLIKLIDRNIKEPHLKNAEKKITKYFIRKASFKKNKIKVNKRNKLNVLISSHCFTDAVHVHGTKNCFEDYYEWINFLGKLSNKIDHNWLIKLHPSEYDNNKLKIEYFTKKYPNLKLLPKDTKNINLIKKIDIVLTVYGTVGREFPLFGIPVINASKCGPHSGYKFNYHFDNFKSYRNAVENLDKYIKNFKINKKEIFEFFYLRYSLDFSFLFNSEYINNINEYLRIKNIDPLSISEIWLKKVKYSARLNILKQVKKFIESEQYRFTANNNDKYSSFIKLKKN